MSDDEEVQGSGDSDFTLLSDRESDKWEMKKQCFLSLGRELCQHVVVQGQWEEGLVLTYFSLLGEAERMIHDQGLPKVGVKNPRKKDAQTKDPTLPTLHLFIATLGLSIPVLSTPLRIL